jgi:formate dehydrogenase major subunit
MVVGTENGRVVHIEGDSDHPISEGALCSKGASLVGTINSPARVTRPRYRAPGAREWTEVSWDWALDRIARLVKKTRDSHWIERDEQGRTVRRTEAIAHVGSAALDNEECILVVKAMRALGLCYIEHQARI